MARRQPQSEWVIEQPDDDGWEMETAPAANDGWEVETPRSPFAAAAKVFNPTGRAHDGDTFALKEGGNARLYGVDAFELDQQGRTIGGASVPLGVNARDTLIPYLPGSKANATGASTYGRPVTTLGSPLGDGGRGMVESGFALPVPKYLKSDPPRLTEYVTAQRDAIADERGAYAGQYQLPAEYRKQGDAAEWRGKVPMTDEQSAAYGALVRNPETTPEQLQAWATAQGHTMTNAENILSWYRKNPKGALPGFFQQRDVLEQPVLRSGPGAFTRAMAALNEGVADFLGAPVDIVNAGLGATGLPVSDTPFLGSESIRSGMHSLGIGQTDDSYSPRSDVERYGQSFARGLGQSVVPAGAIPALGFRAALATAPRLANPSAAYAASREILSEAARRPGVVIAGELGAGGGSGLGYQVADDYAPGNPWAATAGQLIGGFGGGVAAGLPVSRMGRRGGPMPRGPEPTARPDAPGSDFAYIDDDGALTFNMPDETSAPMPGPTRADMAADVEDWSVTAPARQIDRIDINDLPAANDGDWVLEEPSMGRARPLLDQPTPDEIARSVENIQPGDVRPIPGNMVESLDEFEQIGSGLRPLLEAPDEYKALGTRWTPSQRAATRLLPHKGPLDMVSWLRTRGGLRPEGGELASMGIDNTPRGMDFAQGEQRMGRLVDPVNGMSLDEAADAAWRAGYIDAPERPTIDEFLDVLDGTHSGRNRAFLADDLEEIDHFYGQQDQRYRVMQADAEGSPLVDDRGRPVTLDDMEANAPPAVAYEDLPRVGGTVGNINLAHIETRGDIRRLLQNTETRLGGFDAARRGVISHEETAALAGELGMTPADLIKRRQGQALNAEQALAARQILAKSGDEMLVLARKADGGTDDDLLNFRQAMIRHAAIQEQVSGMTAEAGRALAQFKINAKARAVNFRVHQAMIDGAGGREGIENAAKAILDLQRRGVEPGKLNTIARDMLKPSNADKVVELWYNSLLSGPTTHAVNIVSNMVTAASQIPEYLVASAIGQARRPLAKLGMIDAKDISNRVAAREIVPRIVGMVQGVRESLPIALRALRTGDVPDFVTKVEARSQKAISGLKGEVIRVPSKMLAAEDEVFKAIARRMEMNGLSIRKAMQEGLEGGEVWERAAELQANPTGDMIEQALDYGRYLTFQRPLQGLPLSISQMTQKSPWMKAFLPFIRTPTNILLYATERTPFAPAMKSWRADLNAGGPKRDLAIAKMTVGTGLALAVSQMAEAGDITGSGPLDRGAEQLLRADGWQPYSIRIGDQYYSYQRLDPLAMTLGVAADIADKSRYMTDAQAQKHAGLLISSIINNLGSKTWLSGITDVTQAIADSQRHGERVVNRLAGSATVPTFVANIARTTDDVQREVRSPLDAIKNRVPGLSNDLPAKRDVWGADIIRNGGVGPDIISPFWTSERKNDPLNNELLRLGVGMGWGRIKIDGQPATDEQMDRFKALAGPMRAAALRSAVDTPEWRAADDEQRRDWADEIDRRERKRAKEMLFGGRPRANPVADLSTPNSPVVPDGWELEN